MVERGMMTGWRIEPGYPATKSQVEAWEAIKEAVGSVSCQELIREYKGPLEEAEEGWPLEMARYMTDKQGQDLSVKISEDDQVVRLLASGGGKGREMKEHMRRAFIRCVLKRTAGFNVDITSG